MSDQSYVRTEMLSEQPAPFGETGILRWLRAKFFSNVANSITTIIMVYILYWLLAEFLHWAWQPSWGMSSRRECFDAASVTGACWGVIPERFNQLMFGFYPRPDQWRPLAAGILLFVAIAPVLFRNLPRKLLAFSVIYPFLAFWLIWGGSIWSPLMVMAGFGIGYASVRFITPVFGNLTSIIVAVLAAIIWWLFLASPVASAIHNIIPFGLISVKSSLMGGLMLSIIIGAAGIAFSFPLGIILALGRRSDMFTVKILSVGYIEFIRGVPLITLLFVASTLLNYFLPPGTNFDLLLRVIILVTMFQAAYLAEVIRGALAALPVGQYEAADALGLDYWKSMRLVIMPQALKISIPGIVGSFIGLFKDTTLVSIISLLDPVGFINAIRGTAEWQGILWELYVFLILMFWIFTFSMSRYSMYLERKLQTGH